MNAIWKYEIPIQSAGAFTLRIPQGAKLLAVQKQDDVPMLWALVETINAKVGREFLVQGTGHEFAIGKGFEYVATWQSGLYVWHLLDKGEVS